MSLRELTAADKDLLNLMFDDLKILFKKDEILVSEVNEFLSELKSSEVKSFITSLASATKPETALRESFFAGQSLLSRYLASDMIPEVNTGDGFVDYKMVVGNRFILLELKPLFEKVVRDSHSGKELVKLKQKKLDWKIHEKQILKYIKQGGEYIVITDLKDWYFFDDTVTASNCKPFYETTFSDLKEDLTILENIYDLIESYKYKSIKETLGKEFFKDLKIWLDSIASIEFEVDDNQKIHLTLGIINKFIFVQTLQDHNIIEFQWAQKRWQNAESMWGSRHREVLEQFFDDTIKWFFKSYDTELFIENEILKIKKDDQNMKKFYNAFKTILGITYLESDIGGQRGIMQYNFKFIDEDIFGRAYETYLASIRHDEGIYYTPSYVTQYITEETVGKYIDKYVVKIKEDIKSENFSAATKTLNEFIDIKIIDPSCGSGSFLIKAFRILWDRYKDLRSLIDESLKESNVYDTSLTRDSKMVKKEQDLQKLKQLLGFETNRDLISKLLLRHIFGNDLDSRAISTAKVNLWLEAIKQSPKDFVYANLPSHTNRILPYLDMNLINGNAVVSMPNDLVMDYLSKNCKDDISKLSKLRHEYIADSTREDLVCDVVDIVKKLNLELMGEFSKYLEKIKISDTVATSTIPLFWPVSFWYLYFDNSNPLETAKQGADCVIGNPPYERIQVLKKKAPDYVEFLTNSGFKSATKNYDLAVIFIEKGYDLLKHNGEFGYITTNKFVQADYGIGLRKYITENQAIHEIIDFGDQQVFDDASTYTGIFFLKKAKLEEFKVLQTRKLLETKEQLELEPTLSTKETEVFLSNNSELSDEAWVFVHEEGKKILEKLESMKKLGVGDDTVADRIFQGLITGADPIFILKLVQDNGNTVTAFSKSLNKKVELEKELTRPLLKGQHIKRWYVSGYDDIIIFPYLIKGDDASLVDEKTLKAKYPKLYDYFTSNKTELEARENGKWKGVKDWYAHGRRQNIEQFDKPKIMTQVLANRASFSLDLADRYYFVGGGNAGGYGVTIPKESEISLECLLAYLNSSFLDWKLRHKTSKFQHGFFSYAKRFIEVLPINTVTDKKITDEIENNVKQIIANKQESVNFSSVWKHWSEQMSDAEKSLWDIIYDEESDIKDGNDKNLWFETVSFFISKKNEILKREFDYLQLFSNSENSSIIIAGVKEETTETLYEITFKNPTMLDHFYMCLNNILESRAKILTLQDLFEKTMIPVLRPYSPEKTPNLMKKIQEEFSKISPTGNGIVKLVNQIQECEAKIDTMIFKIYGLDKTEMSTVMEDLSLQNWYKNMVLNNLED